MSRVRKAIGAFIAPFLTIPLAAYITGEVAVDWALLAVTAVTAISTAYAVWQVPNAR